MDLLELWLKRWHRIPDADARALVAGTFNLLGTHLWKLALDNPIGAEIIRVLAAERKLPADERTPLRIRISVSEDAGESLGSLPWEFTRYPGDSEVGSFFLASATSLVFGRWVGEVPDVDIRTATDGVVRVLFISALPAADEFADERERFAGMRDELKKLRQQGQGPALDVLEPIESWQPQEIERVLKEHSRRGRHIDVVHLIAICRGDGRNGSRLMRQLDDGQLVFEPADLFADALIGDDLQQPGLVVLHLSDDTRPDEEVSEHFERLAPKFIKAGVPAVLAMQYPLTKGTDVTFLKSFYGKLIGGQSIGAAVQESRKALSPRRGAARPALRLRRALLPESQRRVPARGRRRRGRAGRRAGGVVAVPPVGRRRGRDRREAGPVALGRGGRRRLRPGRLGCARRLDRQPALAAARRERMAAGPQGAAVATPRGPG